MTQTDINVPVDGTITSAKLSGDLTLPGDLSFADNNKAIFGADSDLAIYHNGSNGFVENETGLLILKNNSDDRDVAIQSDDGSGGVANYLLADGSTGALNAYHYGALKLATTSTGIDVTGTVTANDLTLSDGTNPTLTITDTTNTTSLFLEAANLSTTVGTSTNHPLKFDTNNTERMRIDESGLVGIGTTSPSRELEVTGSGNVYLKVTAPTATDSAGLELANTDATWLIQNDDTSSEALTFDRAGTEVMRIDSSGNVGIGTNAPSKPLQITDATNDGTGGVKISSYLPTLEMDDISGGGTSFILQQDGTSTLFKHDANERMRIDSSGNLLVGTTNTTPFDSSTEQGTVISDGQAQIAGTSTPLYLNRQGSYGTIADFRKDGSTVGSIGIESAGFYIDGESAHAGLSFAGFAVVPRDNGARVDNAVDLGSSSHKFRVVYAGTGTINTSDRNEKQDIEALSDAEQRVAVAAKGLLRKFRFVDAVEAKGDEARIHFGIIAQDLQDAFTAEGLDAARYAMWCSDTWTDEETGEERTRLGVRYSELLAFIISAI
jgi:hypothetical protein